MNLDRKMWIIDDLSKREILEKKAIRNNYEAYVYQDNIHLYLTDCHHKIVCRLNDTRPELDEDSCIKINIKSYLYSTLAIIKEEEKPYVFIFVKEFNIIDKNKIGNLFDKKVLLNSYHKSLDGIKSSFEKNRILRSYDRNSFNHTATINTLKVNNKKENRNETTSNLTTLIKDMSSLGSLENYTCELLPDSIAINKKTIENNNSIENKKIVSNVDKEDLLLITSKNSSNESDVLFSSQINKNMFKEFKKLIDEGEDEEISDSLLQSKMSTQINSLGENKLNFKTLSPIQEKQKQSKFSNFQQNDSETIDNEKTNELTDDDDSIDAVFIEKDKIIEETKADLSTVANSRRNERLESVASSSNSSEISLNQSLFIHSSNKKKRRKLLENTHHESFYGVKKSKRDSSIDSVSLDLSSSDDEDSNSITKSMLNVSNNDDEVIECCSQSLVFASKNDKILKLKSLSEKKIKENNKVKASTLFKPLLSEKKVSKAIESPKILKEQVDRLNFNKNFINSPSVEKNSKVIDEIMTSKENNEKLNSSSSSSSKRGPRRLFDAISHLDNIDSAFDESKPSKSTTNTSVSTTKSSETSIPLGQKQPSLTSFSSENNSNNDQEVYLIELKKKLALFSAKWPINGNDLNNLLIKRNKNNDV